MTESKEEIKKHIGTCIENDGVSEAITPDIFQTQKREKSVSCENGHIIKIEINDENEITTESDSFHEKIICQECLKKVNEQIINNKNS